ncbi:hypothetical protein CK500_15180 [Halorubrum salipaludis]|uniref:Uncharacterized protein n=1 Tax=Halorubrum salipaludis TaxID=2032630 RepID=A0A2A2F5Y9_9EURY|nr:hypothetical protein [Halorubrum salipaludis]PAU80866.1 hypothetical protein CK500_15180 [Halorubrum salipaludis]
MDKYDRLLDLIAAHPGADLDELHELADDADGLDAASVDDCLDNALAREDALEANEHYWVMRTGRFHPDEYDHPMTGEWRDRDD